MVVVDLETGLTNPRFAALARAPTHEELAAASCSVKLEPAPELDAESGDDERKSELETMARGN